MTRTRPGRGTIARRAAGFAAALVLAAFLIPMAVAAGRAEASRFLPDSSFGTGGTVNLLPTNGAGGVIWQVRNVEPGPEGTIYVFYAGESPAQRYQCESTYLLARLLPAGTLDPGFGSGGYVQVTAPVGCRYPEFAVDRSLRPIVTWTSDAPSGVDSSTLAVTRLLPSGGLDPSFGTAGTALVQLPCPQGTGADVSGDPAGRLILQFGCREGGLREEGEWRSYLARLGPGGALDTAYGGSGFIRLSWEPGWEPPRVSAVEADGSLLLSQVTEYRPNVQRQWRLARLNPAGFIAAAYGARVERSLSQLSRLALPEQPEEPTVFLPRPRRGIAVAGRSSRGGWVVALRHDGSLDREFSGDGYRHLEEQILQASADPRGRLLLLSPDYGHGATFYRLEPDGSRDPSVGGPRGVRLGSLRGKSIGALIATPPNRPVLYFDHNTTSCPAWGPACTEPAELLRLRLVPPEPHRGT